MTATIAASSQASRPGATWRWKSASSAVSVTRGSITTIERCSSLAIAFNVVRACGMLWLIHGFLPTKKATSHSSNSPRTALPNMAPFTQISPLFSWAMALLRYSPPNPLCSAAP